MLVVRTRGQPARLECPADAWFGPLADDATIAGRPRPRRELAPSDSVHEVVTSCASRTAHATRSMIWWEACSSAR